MNEIWAARFRGPVFVLTADQDWAPDWALAALLDDTVRDGVPLHLFVTSRSPVVDEAPEPGLTLGIHPNFLPGSTHGDTADAVITHCQALAPEATTFRCHSFHENSRVLGKLFARGFRADSNLGLFAQAGIVPLFHCTGLLRFPVFFEDDVFFGLAGPGLSLGPLRKALFAPGIKILSFHPTLVGLNAPSQEYYDSRRARLTERRDGDSALEFGARGTRTILRELIREIRSSGCEFLPFPDLVSESQALIERHRGSGLYEWGRRSWVMS